MWFEDFVQAWGSALHVDLPPSAVELVEKMLNVDPQSFVTNCPKVVHRFDLGDQTDELLVKQVCLYGSANLVSLLPLRHNPVLDVEQMYDWFMQYRHLLVNETYRSLYKPEVVAAALGAGDLNRSRYQRDYYVLQAVLFEPGSQSAKKLLVKAENTSCFLNVMAPAIAKWSTDGDVLRLVSQDASSQVREFLACNEHTPADVQEMLPDASSNLKAKSTVAGLFNAKYGKNAALLGLDSALPDPTTVLSMTSLQLQETAKMITLIPSVFVREWLSEVYELITDGVFVYQNMPLSLYTYGTNTIFARDVLEIITAKMCENVQMTPHYFGLLQQIFTSDNHVTLYQADEIINMMLT